MLFNSLSYAIFLPIVFFLYWLIPSKYRWILILVSSYLFYMSWKPQYVILIIFITLVSYVCALLIDNSDNNNFRKGIAVFSSLICFGVLFFFKYFNFFCDTIVSLLIPFSIEAHPITLKILLPVGVSFYTFQTVSYVIDVYYKRVSAEKNLGIYATFISFFPQLVAGPIERTTNLLPQIKKVKQFDYHKAIYGARLMLWGFFKKIAVADVIAIYVDSAYANLRKCSRFDLYCAVFFFSIQIYCDFSGYSDIAVGTAKLFGIDLMQNFNSPYLAKSVKEFWGRWHISLSTWFRDYVYIPLGGNRCSNFKNGINVIITFLLSGLWHGANWTYVVWGGLHGIGRVVERKFENKRKSDNIFSIWIKRICVFIFVSLCWVFFRADNFNDAFYVINRLFSHYDYETNLGFSVVRMMFSLIAIMIVLLYDYFSLKEDIIERAECSKKGLVLIIEYILLALICISVVKGSGLNQFVYFQF